MAERLIEACKRARRPYEACAKSLIAYELNELSASRARAAVVDALLAADVPEAAAKGLAEAWVRTGDYLADAPRLPMADFVLGNPPYIRLEDLEPEALAFYRDSYGTMRGRADIYVGFFEAALHQLKPNGICVFVCADRWMSNQYGARLRSLITGRFAVDTLIELHDADAFEREVSAYPAITCIRRGKQNSVVVARIERGAQGHAAAALKEYCDGLRSERHPEPIEYITGSRVDHWVTGEQPWPCSTPDRIALLRRLETIFEPLEDEATGTVVSIGVASGCDKVFITKDPEIVESSRLLPLARVSDLKAGVVVWSGHYLVNPWDESGLVNLASFPRLHGYLRLHEASLRGRNVAKRRPEVWFRTIDRVRVDLTSKPKLYFPDIRDTIHPVLDHGGTYPHHNLYYVTSTSWDLEVLGGLLLSAVGQFFVEMYGVRMRGGWLRFQAQYLRRIRVPKPESISPPQAKRLRTAFAARDVESATEVACEIYGIDPEFFGART
ncbi:MAG: Eco57I restriction-modification methylase domain-containing protein [Polyangiales bacterium]